VRNDEHHKNLRETTIKIKSNILSQIFDDHIRKPRHFKSFFYLYIIMLHSLHNLKVSQKIKSKTNFDALLHIKDNFHIPLVMKKNTV
jgi:hypothetical protein